MECMESSSGFGDRQDKPPCRVTLKIRLLFVSSALNYYQGYEARTSFIDEPRPNVRTAVKEPKITENFRT